MQFKIMRRIDRTCQQRPVFANYGGKQGSELNDRIDEPNEAYYA